MVSAIFFFILLVFSFTEVAKDIVIFFPRQFLYNPRKFKQEISNFKKENLSLKLSLREYANLKEENERLTKIIGFKTEKGFDLIGVGVVAFSPSNWHRLVLINAGFDKELKPGLLAIDENGNLVGKIIDVKRATSRVVLVNDPDFNLSVVIGESGQGLLRGNLTGAKILYIEDADMVKLGDIIWFKSAALPSALAIGEITSIKKDPNSLFWDVDARLFFKNTFFDKLFIIKWKK